jgi:hypothetical protein
MRDIDGFFQEAPRGVLYHYTGIDALLGIEASKSLFASHAYHLNDAGELLYGCGYIRREILQRIEQSDRSVSRSEANFYAHLRRWLDTFSNGYPIFLFSLSERPDLLSQWRSYTKHGRGLALGLSEPRVRALLGINAGFRLARCLYSKEDHERVAHALLGMCFESFVQRQDAKGSELKDEEIRAFLESYREDFLQVMAVIKHEAFSEEQEWRLVSPYVADLRDPRVKFRAGAAMLVPYIELKLPIFDGPSQLFDTVVLGPSKHPNLAMSALGAFLFQNKACSHVHNANIPYREW